MRTIRNIPSIFIICFWIVMMGLLVKKEFLPQSIPSQRMWLPKVLPYIAKWGIYSKADKIGYLKTKVLSTPFGYIWENISKIKLFSEDSVLIRGTGFFDKNEKFKDFYISLRRKDSKINMEAKVKGKFLKIILNKKEQHLLPWIANTDVVNNGMFPWFYFSELKVGNKFKWYIINPLTRTRDLVKAIVNRETFYYNRADFIPVTVVDLFYQDTRLEFWIDDAGNPMKVITPWGWTLEAE